jgi:hypothetical protein
MKKIFVISLSCALLFGISACNNPKKTTSEPSSTTDTTSPPSNDREFKRYEVVSGIVEYALGGAEEGTEILYFEDYGNIEARHKTAQAQVPGGIKLPQGVELPKTEQVNITKGDTIYSYDVNTRAGTKLNNTLDVFGKQGNGDDLQKMGMEMLKNMGAVQDGTKTVAGYECDLYVIEKMNTQTCIYKGVTLESTVIVVGITNTITAKSAQFDVDIPEDKISVPDDVSISDQGNIQDLLKNINP